LFNKPRVTVGHCCHQAEPRVRVTAIAIDPHEAEPGPIVLQGDHGPVQFRNIVVTPLVK
jgi:hypothetical protein